MLKIVVFFAGAVLMALEIVGSRLLAPYFGSSIFVWGSLISIFLAGLSGGYYAGGVMADRYPSPLVMGSFLCLPAIVIFLLPLVSAPVNRLI
ncbi:MAG: spermidine synthase, partial [Nitrospinota bacterium]